MCFQNFEQQYGEAFAPNNRRRLSAKGTFDGNVVEKESLSWNLQWNLEAVVAMAAPRVWGVWGAQNALQPAAAALLVSQRAQSQLFEEKSYMD